MRIPEMEDVTNRYFSFPPLYFFLSDHSPISATFELTKTHIPNSPQLLLDADECMLRFTSLSAEGLRAVSRPGAGNVFVTFESSFMDSQVRINCLLAYVRESVAVSEW